MLPPPVELVELPEEPVLPPPVGSFAGADDSGLDPVAGEEPPFPEPLLAVEDPLPFVSSRFCASTYPESR